MPATVIDLTGFASSDGFVLQGEADYDGAGGSVSNAGDINGDGIDDLIILAAGGDDGGNNAGQVYVVYGHSGVSRGRVDLATLAASDGFVIQGDVADFQLDLVSAAGDVNGDGIDDLIIGAHYGDDGAINGGQAYVVYGQSGTARGRVDLANLATSDGFVILGKDQGDYAGYSVSGGGDINGDGIDDLIVGAPRNRDSGVGTGAVYVVYGKAGAARTQIDLATLAAVDGFAILGDSLNGNGAGARVAEAGDVNGDGIDDLMLLSQNSGKIYVVFGKTGSTRPILDLFGLAASDGYVIRLRCDCRRRRYQWRWHRRSPARGQSERRRRNNGGQGLCNLRHARSGSHLCRSRSADGGRRFLDSR
jgi:FG-GAP repeat